MPLYEVVFIARNDVTQQQVESIADTIGAQVDADNGIAPPAADEVRGPLSVKKREYWGLRGLAYRIKKNRKGHYSLMALDAPAPAVKEMERQLSLNEDVLRYMTVRVEELDLELSPVLARRDREGGREGREGRGDRGDRGDREPRPERVYDDAAV